MVGVLRQTRVAFAAALKQMMDKVGLAPGVIGFAAEKCFDGKCAAMNLAALDAEIDIGAAGIAGDNLKFRADGFLQQFREIGVRPGDAGGAAFRRLFGRAHILDGFVRRVGAHVHLAVAARRRADPRKLRPIELNLRSADQLIQIERWDHRADDRQTVGLDTGVEMIHRDHMARAGHILHDETGIARNMPAHVIDDQPRPEDRRDFPAACRR